MLVTVVDGVATRVRGDPAHPPTQGVLCTKVSRYLERTYSPDRILYPDASGRRQGPGGREIRADRLGRGARHDCRTAKAIAADDPQAILPYAFSGTLGLVQNFGMPRRFFHRIGASLPERSLCSTAGRAAYNLVIGAQIGTDIAHFAESRLIVLWGTNPIASNLHLWTRIAAGEEERSLRDRDRPVPVAFGGEGRLASCAASRHRRGAGIWRDACADPGGPARRRLHRTLHAGLRGAEGEGRRLHARNCRAHRRRARPDDVCRLARAYGAERASAIRVNFGLQRHAGGGNAVRAIACLPALTGAWRVAAGGVLLDQAGAHALDLAALDGRDLLPDPQRPPRTVHMAQLGRALHRARRSTDPGAVRLCLQSDGRRTRQRARAQRTFRARTCSRSCTRSFLPTPATMPTSCCRPPRNSSSTTCTGPTARSTRCSTSRRSRRLERPAPTPNCSAGWRFAWASMRNASAKATRKRHGTLMT